MQVEVVRAQQQRAIVEADGAATAVPIDALWRGQGCNLSRRQWLVGGLATMRSRLQRRSAATAVPIAPQLRVSVVTERSVKSSRWLATIALAIEQRLAQIQRHIAAAVGGVNE